MQVLGLGSGTRNLEDIENFKLYSPPPPRKIGGSYGPSLGYHAKLREKRVESARDETGNTIWRAANLKITLHWKPR